LNRPRVAAFYGYAFFSHLLPLYAVYTVIIHDQFQSPLILSTLLAVWSLTIVVLEIPSGALADFWNKKHVALIGQASKVITCLIWFLSHSYLSFLVGFIFWGIQESFCSGSVDALLYEEAEQNGGETAYERHYSWCYRLTTVAVTLAIFSGAYLYRVQPVLVFLISISTSLAGLVCTLLFPARPTAPADRSIHGYFGIIGDALRQARANPVILRLFAYSIGYVTVIGVIEEYLPVFLQTLGQSALLFGLGLASIMAAQSLGGFVSQWLGLKTERAQYLLAGASCLALALVRFSAPGFALALLFLVFGLIGILEIKLSVTLNDAISGERATVLSLQSLAVNAAAILLSLGIGAVAEAAGLAASFLVFAGLGGLVLLILYRLSVSSCIVDRGPS
jgi:MFS family permease